MKYEALKEHLLKRIVDMKPGDRLPPVRNLMDTYNVSQATVTHALEQLRLGGRIESSVGRGTYICTQQAEKNTRELHQVDLFFFSDSLTPEQPSFHRELFEHLSRELGDRNAWLRTTILSYTTTMVSDIIVRIEELACEAVLLVNPNSGDDVFDVFSRRKIPCVAMFPSLSVQPTNSLLIDNRSVVRNWLGHLFGLGHRKISILHHASEKYYSRDHHQRLQFLYEEFAQAGVLPNPNLIRYCGFTAEDSYQTVRRMLEEKREFTALICGDNTAPGVYRALHEKGLRIGRDVSVISVDDCLWAEHMHPPLTTVRIPRKQIASEAVEMLQNLVETGETRFPSKLVASNLVVRESTGPAPAQNEV